MAQKFVGVPQPYAGLIPGITVGLCKPSNLSPRAAFVDIDWSKYTTGNVSIDLLTVSAGQQLDMIKAVFIDNIGMVLPVTIFFPDTQFEVTCQSNATESQNVLTGQLQCQVILGKTAISLSQLTAATTRVWFLNVNAESFINPIVPQSVPVYEASNLPGTPQLFVSKPAGEQHGSFTYNFATGVMFDNVNNAAVSPSDLFSLYTLPQAATSYMVITDVYVWKNGCYCDKKDVALGETASIVNMALFRNPTPTASLMQWIFSVHDLDDYKFEILQDSHGLFYQLNPFNSKFTLLPTSLGPVATNGLNGIFNFDFQYTYVSLI
jgi:hypothetical protein